MKKTKILLTLVCAILLVAASVMGTLAYLKAETQTVTNTFTVGNVGFDTELNGGLDEAKTNEYGVPLKKGKDYTDDKPVYEECKDVKDAVRVTGNEYTLIPGHTYTKDPTVHMSATSEDAYLFVTVSNGISAIEATGDTTIAEQMEKLGWVQVKNGDTAVANTYIYYGTTTTKDETTGGETTTVNKAKTPVHKEDNITVFNTFTLRGDADVSVYGSTKIEIKAYAIQADGLSTKTDYELWELASAKSTT